MDLYPFYVEPQQSARHYPRRGECQSASMQPCLIYFVITKDSILPGGLRYIADNPAQRDLVSFTVRPGGQETQRVRIGKYEGKS